MKQKIWLGLFLILCFSLVLISVSGLVSEKIFPANALTGAAGASRGTTAATTEWTEVSSPALEGSGTIEAPLKEKDSLFGLIKIHTNNPQIVIWKSEKWNAATGSDGVVGAGTTTDPYYLEYNPSRGYALIGTVLKVYTRSISTSATIAPSGTAGQGVIKILYIGDSLSVDAGSNFGGQLTKKMKDNGYQVVNKAVGGTGIYAWIHGNHGETEIGSLESHLIKENHSVVLIGLGTNVFNFDKRIKKESAELISKIPPQVKCIWIGPPAVRENPPTFSGKVIITSEDIKKVFDALSESVSSRCTLIDSRKYVSPSSFGSGGDGIHVSGPPARVWAEGVFNEISSILSGAQPVSSPTAATGSTLAYSFTPREKEIDDVWKIVSGVLLIDKKNQVWVPTLSAWMNYNQYYAPPGQAQPQILITTYFGKLSNHPLVKEDLLKPRYDDAFLTKLEEISTAINVPSIYLLQVMWAESKFNPKARNPTVTKATGLIQFTSNTAKGLGTTVDELIQMSQVQQLDYVKKYFIGRKCINVNDYGEVATCVFYGHAKKGPDSIVLYEKGSDGYRLNPGVDVDKDGKITKGDYVKFTTKDRDYLAQSNT